MRLTEFESNEQTLVPGSHCSSQCFGVFEKKEQEGLENDPVAQSSHNASAQPSGIAALHVEYYPPVIATHIMPQPAIYADFTTLNCDGSTEGQMRLLKGILVVTGEY